MIAPARERVERQSYPAANRRIEEQIQMSISFHRDHPERIARRLRELDREWDIERVLETGSSCLTLYGLVRGILGRRRWLLLSLAVQGFFLQHALQGWCPPLPVLRAMGVRTVEEIERERYALLQIQRGGNGEREAASEMTAHLL